MSDLCLKKDAFTVCSTIVPSCDLCQIFASRMMNTQCAVRRFPHMTYSDLCLKNEAYTVCLLLCMTYVRSLLKEQCTMNSRLADTPLLQTLAIMDKIQICSKSYRGLTRNNSCCTLYRYQSNSFVVLTLDKVDTLYFSYNIIM